MYENYLSTEPPLEMLSRLRSTASSSTLAELTGETASVTWELALYFNKINFMEICQLQLKVFKDKKRPKK